MAKFICLTQACGNVLTKPLIINADHIQHVTIGDKGRDVHVCLSDGTFFFVKESVKDIRDMIAGVPITVQGYANTAHMGAKRAKSLGVI
jgi:uncharacterized protein YlzI (FlbEa/FlbD family)